MKIKAFIKKYVPVLAPVSLAIFAASGILYVLAVNITPIADFLNRTVGTAVRFLLAGATAWLPFSLFELLLILILPLSVLFVVYMVKTRRGRVARVRSLLSLVSVVALILSSYVFTLGVGYRTTPLADNLGIEDARDISKEELYSVTERVVSEVNSLAKEMNYEDGESVMPYTLGELSSRLSDSYASLAEDYDFISSFRGRVKPVLFSTVMSDAGITGIYSFFTGEANVNIEYPHYDLPFTAAHEMAHQRGIARENEANFTAYLVCIRSEDAYIRYSGYLSMFEYLASALYSADRELYAELWQSLDENARADIRASNAVTAAHRDSLLNKLNDRLNDGYLKLNGTEGVVSYGYVVRLTVGYYRTNP